MTQIYDLQQRADVLRKKTATDSISPEEVGGLHADTLAYIANMERYASSLGIKKVYTSVSEMNGDESPVSSTGMPLKAGQLVTIFNAEAPDAENSGEIYAFQNPGWLLAGRLDSGNYSRLSNIVRGETVYISDNIRSPYTFIGNFATWAEVQTELDKLHNSDGGADNKVIGEFRVQLDGRNLIVRSWVQNWATGVFTQTVEGSVRWNGETMEQSLQTNTYERTYNGGSGWGIWQTASSSGGNMILDWKTDVATTRKQVMQDERKAGMMISYKNVSGEWINEQYVGTSFDDTSWAADANWQQIGASAIELGQELSTEEGSEDRAISQKAVSEEFVKIDTGVFYDNSSLEDGSYRISNASVGSAFTGSPFNDSCGRIKLSVKNGDVLLLKTYSESSPGKGIWNGYVLTDTNDICVSKVISQDAFNTLDEGIIINIEQDGWLYVSCNNDYRERFSLKVLSKIDELSQKIEDVSKNNKEYTDLAIANIGDTTLLKKYNPYTLTNRQIRYEDGYVHDRNLQPHGTVTASDYIAVDANCEYVINGTEGVGAMGSFFDINKEFISNLPSNNNVQEVQEILITTPSNAAYIRFNVNRRRIPEVTFAKVGYEDKYSLKDLVVTNDQFEGNVGTEQSNASIRFNRVIKPLNIGETKKLLAFGDSITVGVQSSSSYEFANEGDYKYVEVLTNKLNMTLINKAVSGQTSEGMLRVVKSYSGETPDAILIAIGTNDYQVDSANVQLGSYADVLDTPNEDTFYGRLDAAVKFLKNKYADATIILLSPINFITKKTKENNLNKFRNAVQFVASVNDVSFIDGECMGFPSSSTKYSNVVLADGCHPTSLGHKIMGETIASLLI